MSLVSQINTAFVRVATELKTRVRFDSAQSLTPAQQAQARANVNVPAVLFYATKAAADSGVAALNPPVNTVVCVDAT